MHGIGFEPMRISAVDLETHVLLDFSIIKAWTVS